MRDGCWLNCSQRIVWISTEQVCSWRINWTRPFAMAFLIEIPALHTRLGLWITLKCLTNFSLQNKRISFSFLFEFSFRFWLQIFLRLSCVTVEVKTLKATIRASCKKRNHIAQKTRTSIDTKSQIKSKQKNINFQTQPEWPAGVHGHPSQLWRDLTVTTSRCAFWV